VSDRQGALAREARWALPTAIASFAAVALLIASFVVGSSLGGDGEADSLREIHENGGTLVLAGAVQALGFALLVFPFLYLFQAALLRGDRMRSQFRALVVAAPLALALAAVLNGVSASDAASDFVAGRSRATLSLSEASEECRSERKDDGEAFREEFGEGKEALSHCIDEERENDAASRAIEDASLREPAQILQLAGVLALAFAFVYCSLNAMRVGLLSRFWGSLGIALGVASVIGLFQIALLWFAYFGLLVAGWVPGGRPPAWAAGEAVPWPSPGERMAGVEGPDDEDDDTR